MPQLIIITSQSGALLNLRCPYHAKVIKTFATKSRATGAINFIILRKFDAQNNTAASKDLYAILRGAKVNILNCKKIAPMLDFNRWILWEYY